MHGNYELMTSAVYGINITLHGWCVNFSFVSLLIDVVGPDFLDMPRVNNNVYPRICLAVSQQSLELRRCRLQSKTKLMQVQRCI